jgi:hypothetical protein
LKFGVLAEVLVACAVVEVVLLVMPEHTLKKQLKWKLVALSVDQ